MEIVTCIGVKYVQRRHQVKKCGSGVEPPAGPGAEPLISGTGQTPSYSSRKPFKLLMPNESSKFDSFAVFCKLATQSQNVTDYYCENSPDLR